MKRIKKEEEWLSCEEPNRLVRFLSDQPSERKFRLIVTGCCRLLWEYLPDPRSREALEAAEWFIERIIDTEQLWSMGDPAQAAYIDAIQRGGSHRDLEVRAACVVAYNVINRWISPRKAAENLFAVLDLSRAAERPIRRQMASLVRDIAGNPFQKVVIDPEWRTQTVLAVAEGIYTEQTYDGLPILADALEDAGCEDATLLEHCRSAGLHVRGCWALDLILSRE